MKKVSPDVVLKIQIFLKEASIFYGVPSESWSAQAINALKEYRRRKGTKFPNYTTMPGSVEELPEELQKYIQDKEGASNVEVVGEDEATSDTLELSSDQQASLQRAIDYAENNPPKETTGEDLEELFKGEPTEEKDEASDNIEIVTKVAATEPVKQESAPEVAAQAPAAPIVNPTSASSKKKRR